MTTNKYQPSNNDLLRLIILVAIILFAGLGLMWNMFEYIDIKSSS